MNLFGKKSGKSDSKGKIESPKDNASLQDLHAKVAELVDAVNAMGAHIESTHVVQMGGVEKIDLASSKDPAHQAAASEDFQKLQAGQPLVEGHHAAHVDQPTQQNVPSPLPGGPVPTPAEVANAQKQVAEQLDNGGLDGKSSTTAQAEILDSAKGDTSSAK